MTKTSFGDQLQQLWRTRPVRLPRQAPVAGVAAGFGRRYGIDPVLVRVAFVVSTIFGGIGIVLYLLAWLLWSEAGEPASPAEALVGRGRGNGQGNQSSTKTIVLIVALAIAVSTTGPVGIGLGGSGLISLGLMLAGWWMLFLRTPEPPPGTSQLDIFGSDEPIAGTGYPGAAFPQNPYSAYTKLPEIPESYAPPQQANTEATETVVLRKETTDGADASEGTPTTTGEQVPLGKAPASESADARTASAAGTTRTASPTPPAWDPLGVAPLAWDLPDPTPQPQAPVQAPPKRPRSRLTPIVIGHAILAAAIAGALAVAGVEWMTPARIAATALTVIGLGLVIGAFLRRGYGLLVLTAPLAGFVILASAVGPVEFDRGAIGEQTWKPTAVTDLAPEYKVTMGNGTLDLRDLTLTENRTVHLSVQMGNAEVLLPNTMRVRTDCTVSMGNAESCVDGMSGPQQPDAPVLDLNIDVRAGNAEVHRG